MTDPVPVVDLFSGTGGLAEGFAALRDSSGHPRFSIVLSIEMDETAYRMLRLAGSCESSRPGSHPSTTTSSTVSLHGNPTGRPSTHTSGGKLATRPGV